MLIKWQVRKCVVEDGVNIFIYRGVSWAGRSIKFVSVAMDTGTRVRITNTIFIFNQALDTIERSQSQYRHST